MGDGRIVVGIDDSPASKAALDWAVDEARLHGAKLEVVHAWEFPALALAPYGDTVAPMIAPEDLEKAADEMVKAAVAAVPEADRGALTTAVTRGHPADVLLKAAEGADLLVVGSRGRGGFTGMLLGSVSNHVIHHATCPVVVIRDEGR